MQFGPATRSLLLAAASLGGFFFAGCGTGSLNTTASPLAVQGSVHGGQQPIANAIVTVWQAGNSGGGSATELAHVSTDANGNFAFAANAYTCPTPTTQVYITSEGGKAAPNYANPNTLLAASLGNCASAKNQFVVINEVTTAATAFALQNFFTTTYGTASGNGFGSSSTQTAAFALANSATVQQLVNLSSGMARGNETGVTREAAKLNTIADILAACVNDANTFTHCQQLFTDTTGVGSTAPTNTLQAAVSMAKQPFQSVSDLFSLVQATGAPFVGLSAAPTDWTLGIAYTSSDFGLAITPALPSGNAATMDIWSDGVVYFPSNASGKTGVGSFDPSTATFGTLLLANQLTSPQYVVLVPNQSGVGSDVGIGVTDVASGKFGSTTSDSALVQIFTVASDAAHAGPWIFPTGLEPLIAYTSTTGMNALVVLEPDGMGTVLATFTQPATGLAYSFDSGAGAGILAAMTGGPGMPCKIEGITASSGTQTASVLAQTTSNDCTSGGIVSPFPGAVVGMATGVNQACAYFQTTAECHPIPTFSQPTGISLDSLSIGWVANASGHSFTNSTSPNLYVHTDTLPQPYAVNVDGAGNLWFANAGCVSTTTALCAPGAFTLSEMIGVAAPTITPLSAQTAQATSAVQTGSGATAKARTLFPPAGGKSLFHP